MPLEAGFLLNPAHGFLLFRPVLTAGFRPALPGKTSERFQQNPRPRDFGPVLRRGGSVIFLAGAARGVRSRGDRSDGGERLRGDRHPQAAPGNRARAPRAAVDAGAPRDRDGGDAGDDPVRRPRAGALFVCVLGAGRLRGLPGRRSAPCRPQPGASRQMILLRFLPALVVMLSAVSARAEDLGEFVLHHIIDAKYWYVTPWGPKVHFPEWMAGGSLHVFMMFVAAVLLLILLIPAARRESLAPRGRFANMVEAFVIFIRDE